MPTTKQYSDASLTKPLSVNIETGTRFSSSLHKMAIEPELIASKIAVDF
jgi:hypothetical protein